MKLLGAQFNFHRLRTSPRAGAGSQVSLQPPPPTQRQALTSRAHTRAARGLKYRQLAVVTRYPSRHSLGGLGVTSARARVQVIEGGGPCTACHHASSRGIRDSAGVREALQVRGKEPEEHRGQGRSAALLQAAQEGAPRFRPSASTSFRPLFSLSWGKSTLIHAPQLQSGVGDDEGNIRASDTP